MKSDVQTFKFLFQIEYAKNEKELSNLKTTVIIHLVLAKEKLETLASSSELYKVCPSIYSILGTEKTLFTCIVDHGRRESMLPSLARVLLFLVRVCVT